MAQRIEDLFKLPCKECACTGYEETCISGECVECGHLIEQHSHLYEQIPSILNNFVLGGKTDNVILGYLSLAGIEWSLSTLRRRLLEFGIYRHEKCSKIDVVAAVKEEMEKSDHKSGYRRLHKDVRQKHKLKVKRHEIVSLLQELDPHGPAERKARRLQRRVFICDGPNAIWSIDGHDKLASFGIFIHGAIDAWSRRVLWYNCYSTNHDPRFVAHYYLQAVEQNGIVPAQTRSDPGTENVTLAECQMYLRRTGTDPNAQSKSNIVAKSKFNQKIECFWSGLYHKCTRSWWETFVALQRDGKLEAEHMEAFLFIFMPVVRQSVDEYISWWNDHIIRHQVRIALPTGASPNDMFYLPHLYGGEDCGYEWNSEDIKQLRDYHNIPTTLPNVTRALYMHWASDLLERNGLVPTFGHAVESYELLLKNNAVLD